MASEWTDIGSISDGMLADYEVLKNLMSNENWLKDHAVGVSVFKDPSGKSYSTETANLKVRLKAGIFAFNFSGANAQVTKSFSSVNRPLVFATVAGGGGKVSVRVENATTKGATFVLTKTGTGTVKGYINWLAITTE